MKANKLKANKVIYVALLALFFSILFPTVRAFAHDSYFIRILIDRNTMTYTGTVEYDRNRWIKSEDDHKEPSLGAFQSLNDDGYQANGKEDTLEDYKSIDGLGVQIPFTVDSSKSMPFTFPSKQIGGWLDQKNHGTSTDSERAFEILNGLLPNLNQALLIINDDKRYDNEAKLVEATEAVMRASGGGNGLGGFKTLYNGWLMVCDTDGNLNLSKEISVGEPVEYIIPNRMVKGYSLSTLEDGRVSMLFLANEFADDADYLTIGMFGAQGAFAAKIMKQYSSTVPTDLGLLGTLEVKLAEFLMSVVDGLRSTFGLYSLDELIYNNGSRSSSLFYGGIMPKTWMEKAMAFHMIFQAMAWIMLTVAIVKILIQNNLATVNIASKLSLMESIKNLLATGFMLIAVFVLINTALQINARIVAVFETTVPGYIGFGRAGTDNATFSGVLMSLYYLFIAAYMNVIYILRAITTAVLIASAPLFIVSIAFSTKGSKMFTTWSKEMVANIFMQSFHAFTLSLFLSLQFSSRGIEVMIISFALIPLTSFFKNLIVGDSGSMADKVGGKAMAMGVGAVSGALAGAAGGMRAKGGAPSSSKGDSSDKSEGRPDKDSRSKAGIKESQGVLDGMNVTKADTEMSNMDDSNTVSDRKHITNEKSDSAPMPNKLKAGAGTAVRALWAGTKVGAGLAVAAALGSMGVDERGIAGTAGKLISSGTGDLNSGIKKGFAVGKNQFNQELDDNSKNRNHGNVISADKLSNGDVQIGRSRLSMEQEGLMDARMTSEKNLAMTYDRDKLSAEDSKNLESYETNIALGKGSLNADKGVANVTYEGGNENRPTVHYNNVGMEQIGVKEMYSTDSRIVETKSPSNNKNTRMTYDLDKVKVEESNYDKTKRGKPNKGAPSVEPGSFI